MSADDKTWRLGNHYGIHVYEGDRPVATFHNEADARRCVEAVNQAPGAPLYVNHPRTEPVPGDLVRDADDAASTETWWYQGGDNDHVPWAGFGYSEGRGRYWDWRSRSELPDRIRLLVDGNSGQVVQ